MFSRDAGPAIRATDLAKFYRLYDDPVDRLKEALHPLRRKYHRLFWALRDLNLEVPPGQTLGIVGRNGSGKSTLLKILAGVLTPSAGHVAMSGRVAAILELGAGFNPEATGRENIFFSSAVAGCTRAEVEERLPEVAAFADLGEFLGQPVKTYSSGMVMRLAFALTVSLDPDILIIDEALAVGDDAFQRKCFGRLADLRSRGVTVVFVSHNPQTVMELCDRVVLLDRGEMIMDGHPKPVMARYHQLLFADEATRDGVRETIREDWRVGRAGSDVAVPAAEGVAAAAATDEFDPSLLPTSSLSYADQTDRGVRILDPHLVTTGGVRVNNLTLGREYDYRYRVLFSRSAFRVRFGMMIKTMAGLELGGAASAPPRQPLAVVDRGAEAEVTFRFRCLLHPGTYFMNAGVTGSVDGEESYLDRIIDSLMFRVRPEENLPGTGVVSFQAKPTVRFSTAEGRGRAR